MLSRAGDLLPEDTEIAEALTAAFGSAFAVGTCLQEFEVPKMSGKVWRKEDFPQQSWIRLGEHLNKLDLDNAVALEGMRSWMLRELANVTARPRSIPFERSWASGEVPEDWKKENVTPVFKKGKKEIPGALQAH